MMAASTATFVGPAANPRDGRSRSSPGGDRGEVGWAYASVKDMCSPLGSVREAACGADLGGRVAGHGLRGRAAGITIMGTVSQWEREAIGEAHARLYGTSDQNASEWATS